jgi:hypothetical protein
MVWGDDSVYSPQEVQPQSAALTDEQMFVQSLESVVPDLSPEIRVAISGLSPAEQKILLEDRTMPDKISSAIGDISKLSVDELRAYDTSSLGTAAAPILKAAVDKEIASQQLQEGLGSLFAVGALATTTDSPALSNLDISFSQPTNNPDISSTSPTVATTPPATTSQQDQGKDGFVKLFEMFAALMNGDILKNIQTALNDNSPNQGAQVDPTELGLMTAPSTPAAAQLLAQQQRLEQAQSSGRVLGA